MSSGVTLSGVLGMSAIIGILSVMLLPVIGAGRDRSPECAPERWEETIAKFEERDREQSPPEDAVLFTGSSTIVGWKSVAADFPFAPVINRGFGGSQVSDLLHYVDRVILAYRPRVVVIYSGDNDLSAGKSPGQVLADYVALQGRIHAALPETSLLIIAVKPSPRRWHLAGPMQELNGALAAWAAETQRTETISVWDAMLDADDVPQLDLYSDGLHMTSKGYQIWTGIMRPHLQRLWADGAQR